MASKHLGWFTHLYLGHYINFTTPSFHWQIYRDLTNDDITFIEILGFRGSAKSTIASLALPLWSAVTNKRKFIILLSDSFKQAKLIISNIIFELENNKDLIDDFGPFQGKEEWQATNVVLSNNTRIMAQSRGMKIRGLRHLEYRPDLIIGDDIENIESVRTLEQRDKTQEWMLSDVIPALDTISGKLVIIGSLLHTDSLISRLKNQILENKTGIYREYPIIVGGKSLWESKFPQKTIDKIKLDVGQRFFLREYLIHLIPSEGQIIKSVNYYGELPKIKKLAIGVDLAISQKTTADYSAIDVIGEVNGKYYNIKSLAGRWEFSETLQKINDTYIALQKGFKGIPIVLGVEDVAYQKAAIQELRRRYKLPVKEVRRDKDKRSRLESIEPYFSSNQIFFRKNEDADVVNEILNFGIEQHDDRMDAFETALTMLLNENRPEILWI